MEKAVEAEKAVETEELVETEDGVEKEKVGEKAVEEGKAVEAEKAVETEELVETEEGVEKEKVGERAVEKGKTGENAEEKEKDKEMGIKRVDVRMRKLNLYELERPTKKSRTILKEEIAAIFVAQNVKATLAGVRFLSKKSESFLRLWRTYSTENPSREQALNNIRKCKDYTDHTFSNNIRWSAPIDMQTNSPEEIANLMGFFDNPENVTKEDIHLLVNNVAAFRKKFQCWCNTQHTQDEAKLWRKFKSSILGTGDSCDGRRQ